MSLKYKGKTVAGVAGGGSGGEAEEVYSTEETRIGTWIDGKPLYRQIFNFTVETVGLVPIGDEIPDLEIIDIDCMSKSVEGVFESVPFHDSGTGFLRLMYYSRRHSNGLGPGFIAYLTSDYKNRKLIAVVKYTKTTD